LHKKLQRITRKVVTTTISTSLVRFVAGALTGAMDGAILVSQYLETLTGKQQKN
jgi:hypothetical protein